MKGKNEPTASSSMNEAGAGQVCWYSKDEWTGLWLSNGTRLRKKICVCMHTCVHACVYDLFIYFNKRVTFEGVFEGLCRIMQATLLKLATLGIRRWVRCRDAPSTGKRHRGSSLTGDKEREGMLMKRLRIQGSFFLIRLPRMLLKAREREAGLGVREKRGTDFSRADSLAQLRGLGLLSPRAINRDGWGCGPW